MMADNLLNFYMKFGRELTDEEKGVIILMVNAYGGLNPVHQGTVMFLDRELVREALNIGTDTDLYEDKITKIAERLREEMDVEEYWVDITLIGDTYRKELNTVTGQERTGDALTIERHERYFR